ncbi:MAG TPA: META domain-containing protein [Vicinamibacterales bacterium]|nr:META domain-containing protein [Vicinamibacterales bacterium]
MRMTGAILIGMTMAAAAPAPAGISAGQTPGAPNAQQPASSELQGTAWRLVKFQGGDDTTLTPADPSKYTIQFEPKGRLAARIDCNRGSGTWTSKGANQVAFGPMALTRATCPPGSLHDRIVKHWGSIRSYVIRNGHLFLSLRADGGTYEFEPMPKSAATKPGPPPPSSAARFRSGTTEISTRVNGDALSLTLEGKTYTLTHVRAASGAKYESTTPPAVTFWNKGESATLSVGTKEYPPCAKLPAGNK